MIYAIPDGAVDQMIPRTGFIRTLVQYATRQTDAPSVYHVASAISVLSSVMPAGLHYWGPGSPAYVNLFVLVVGLSGSSRKTQSMKIGQDILEGALNGERIGNTPASHGALLDSLRAKPQQIIFDEDMARFLKESKGNGYLSSLKQGLMSIYDCSRQTRDTREKDGKAGTGAVVVEDPRLTLYAAANMTELSDHLDLGDLSSGFYSRFLFLTGKRDRLLPLSQIKPDPQTRNLLLWQLQQRYRLTPPTQVVFSPEAMADLDRWEEDNDLLMRQSDDAQMVSLLSRIPSFSRKLAVLYAVDTMIAHWDAQVETPVEAVHKYPIVVTREHSTAAMMLAKAAFKCVKSVNDNLHATKDMRDRSRVLESMARGTAISMGELCRKAKLFKGEVTRIMETLKEEKMVSQLSVGGTFMYVRIDPIPAETNVPNLPEVAAEVLQKTHVPDAQLSDLPGHHYEPEPVEEFDPSDGVTRTIYRSAAK